MSKQTSIKEDLIICINGPDQGKILNKNTIIENSSNEMMPLSIFLSNFKEIYKVSEIIENL